MLNLLIISCKSYDKHVLELKSVYYRSKNCLLLQNSEILKFQNYCKLVVVSFSKLCRPVLQTDQALTEFDSNEILNVDATNQTKICLLILLGQF